MKHWRVAGTLAVSFLVLLAAFVASAADGPTDRVMGWRTPLGKGQVSSYAQFQESGAPVAIGVVISADALTGLPTEPSDQHHCFDRNGDGAIARPAECLDSHEFVIPLPDAVTRRDDIPFKWVLLNWNAVGHVPPGIYDVPHFDVHFYMTPIADIFAISEGLCGPEFVSCDDFKLAKAPVPADLMHPDFKDVDAVVPAMGNHLIDVGGREFQGEPFTHSWIYGAFNGQVIFYEEMVTLAHLMSRPNGCTPLKSPPAVALSGFYPTQSCIRYLPSANEYSVSMEGFIQREAR